MLNIGENIAVIYIIPQFMRLYCLYRCFGYNTATHTLFWPTCLYFNEGNVDENITPRTTSLLCVIIYYFINPLGEVCVGKQLNLRVQGSGTLKNTIETPVLGFVGNCPVNWDTVAPLMPTSGMALKIKNILAKKKKKLDYINKLNKWYLEILLLQCWLYMTI